MLRYACLYMIIYTLVAPLPAGNSKRASSTRKRSASEGRKPKAIVPSLSIMELDSDSYSIAGDSRTAESIAAVMLILAKEELSLTVILRRHYIPILSSSPLANQ